MLYLSRKIGESIRINDDIVVKVEQVVGKTVKLGIEFPPHVTVLRQELYHRIREEIGEHANIADFFQQRNQET